MLHEGISVALVSDGSYLKGCLHELHERISVNMVPDVALESGS